MFKGSFVALITPFRNGGVDEAKFQDFVAWQVAQGTHGLVPTGTTGEAPTLRSPPARCRSSPEPAATRPRTRSN
jgi:dihydrodipicolinate synthase/N-acetylneuraminate lyase